MTKETVEIFSPPINISISSDLGAGKNMVMQTSVARDDESAIVNPILDKLMDMADRQIARGNIEYLEEQLILEQNNLKGLEEDVSRITEKNKSEWETSGRKGPYTPSVKDKQELVNINSNARKFRQGIERFQKKIDKAKKLIG